MSLREMLALRLSATAWHPLPRRVLALGLAPGAVAAVNRE